MPTEAVTSAAPVRGNRKGVRLAIGVAGIFIVAMAFQWPFAFLSAVFTAMFLQAPAPPIVADFAILTIGVFTTI